MSVQTKYDVTQYSVQKNESKGVAAGMWAVVRTRRETAAFADDRSQAETIKKALEQADKTTISDPGLW